MAQGSEKESPIVTYDDLCHYLTTNTLEEERRKILSFFRVERSFCLGDDIKNDTLFILKLEEYDIISDGNVDRLLKCLESLKMKRLAETVKTYKSEKKTESMFHNISLVQHNDNDSNVDPEKVHNEAICKLHLNQLDFMCSTCNTKICYACGFNDHRGEDHVLYHLLTPDTDSIKENENTETEEINLCKKHQKPLVVTCITCNNRLCYICAFYNHRGKDHVLNFPEDSNQCNEHQKPLTALCNSCNKIVCNVCVFHSHRGKDHVIFSESEVNEKVDETVKFLSKHVAVLDNTIKSKQSSVIQCATVGVTQEPLDAQFDIWAKQAANELSNIEEELKLHQVKKDHETTLFLAYIEKVNTDLEQLRRHLRDVNNVKSKGIQLKKLKEWKVFITTTKNNLNHRKQELQSYCYLRSCFRSLSLDNGRFIKFHISSVIGAVCVSKHLAVVVRDKRHFGGKITLSCISLEHGKLLWEHSADDTEQTYPVVMAGSLYVNKLKRRILIACGRKIFAFAVEDQNEDVKIEKTESKSVPVPEGNYITCINTITNKLGVGDVGVMISTNASTELLRLNEDLDLIERFDCSQIVHSIACLACADRDVALVDTARNEVVLVNTGKIVGLSGKFEAPSNLPNFCRPKVIQWDGSLWGVIWESVDHQRQQGPTWQHSVYQRYARKPHLGISDNCGLNTEIVSISFMQNQTLVCFSDGKVKLFGTNDARTELSELANLADVTNFSELLQMLEL